MMSEATDQFFHEWAKRPLDLADIFKRISLRQMFGPAVKDWDPGPVPTKVGAHREAGRQVLRDAGYSEAQARWIEHANWEWDMKRMFRTL